MTLILILPETPPSQSGRMELNAMLGGLLTETRILSFPLQPLPSVPITS